MLYLYLDESGDLGFDFVTKKPSKFFTVAVLAVHGQANNRAVINAVKRTFKRKLRKKKLALSGELKGCKISMKIKEYLYEQIKDISFDIYALTVNKKRVNQDLVSVKERLYNYISRLILDKIDFNHAHQRVMLILDKSKGRPEIADFNQYVFSQIKGKLNPKIPLDIMHKLSHEMPGLQVVDLFAWGIFRKYEKRDTVWFEKFKGKVAYEDLYLP